MVVGIYSKSRKIPSNIRWEALRCKYFPGLCLHHICKCPIGHGKSRDQAQTQGLWNTLQSSQKEWQSHCKGPTWRLKIISHHFAFYQRESCWQFIFLVVKTSCHIKSAYPCFAKVKKMVFYLDSYKQVYPLYSGKADYNELSLSGTLGLALFNGQKREVTPVLEFFVSNDLLLK